VRVDSRSNLRRVLYRQKQRPGVSRALLHSEIPPSIGRRPEKFLGTALWSSAHLSAATATFAILIGRHGALAIGAACHLATGILGHHRTAFAVLALAGAFLAAIAALGATGCALAAACHLAVCLGLVAAGARLSVVVSGSGCALGRALSHQGQSH